MKVQWWQRLELERYIYLGVGWETIIKINSAFITWASYDFYHKFKYNTDAEIEAGMLLYEKALCIGGR